MSLLVIGLTVPPPQPAPVDPAVHARYLALEQQLRAHLARKGAITRQQVADALALLEGPSA